MKGKSIDIHSSVYYTLRMLLNFHSLLANIALNGIEEIHQSVRYADDMVIILKPKDDAVAILDKVSKFLAERGMKVSEKKTKLTATTDGFDFLGWHFKVLSQREI